MTRPKAAARIAVILGLLVSVVLAGALPAVADEAGDLRARIDAQARAAARLRSQAQAADATRKAKQSAMAGKQAQVTTTESHVNNLQNRLATNRRALRASEADLAAAQDAAARARQAKDRAQRRYEGLRWQVSQFSAQAYRTGVPPVLVALTTPGGPLEVMDRVTTMQAVSNNQHDLVVAMAKARDDMTRASERAAAAEAAEQAVVARWSARVDSVSRDTTQVSRLLGQLQRQERELAAAAAAQARTAATARQGAQSLAAKVVADQARLKAVQLEAARRAAAEAARRLAAIRAAQRGRATEEVSIPSGGSYGGRHWGGYRNGRIPRSALCSIGSGEYLRCDAARSFLLMSAAYRAHFGVSICVTDAYRSYAAQVDVFRRKPALAAIPGTSNHGWGLAADLCGGLNSYYTPQHAWLRANAARFGWVHPGWAKPWGSRPEAWHWEAGYL